MTNRQKLLGDLIVMNNAQLYDAFADNRLTSLIDDLRCEDCEKMHHGCMSTPDDECKITTEQWLDMPCTIDGPMITEEVLTR